VGNDGEGHGIIVARSENAEPHYPPKRKSAIAAMTNWRSLTAEAHFQRQSANVLIRLHPFQCRFHGSPRHIFEDDPFSSSIDPAEIRKTPPAPLTFLHWSHTC
jgi:hypothetical protein